MARRPSRIRSARFFVAFVFAALPLAMGAMGSTAAADPVDASAIDAAEASALADPMPRGRSSTCDADVVAWATRASSRMHRSLTAVDCPHGVVRLRLADAGCDFEVAREGGFRRTADGTRGVSPIADVEWNRAPDPMRRGLELVLVALSEDPSLPIDDGAPAPHRDDSGQNVQPARNADARTRAASPGWRKPKVVAIASGLLLALGAVTARLLQRRKSRHRAASDERASP